MPLLVQSAHNTATSGTTVTVTLGSSTTAGNCVAVPAGAESSSALPTVSSVALGTTGDTFSQAETQSNTTGDGDNDCEIWTDPGCSGGQTSVKVTFSHAVSAAGAYAMEWSGCATSGVVDTGHVNGGNSDSSTTWSSGATGTLSQASNAVIGACWATTFTSPTLTGPSSPWTNLTVLSAGSDSQLIVGYVVTTTTGSQTYSGSATSFGISYASVIVPLKAGSTTVSGTAALAATATLTAVGDIEGLAPLAAAAALTAQGGIEAGATLGATSSLTAGGLVSTALAALHATSSLSGAPVLEGAAALAAAASLEATGGQPGAASLQAAATLAAEPSTTSVYTTCYQKAPDYLDVTGANQ